MDELNELLNSLPGYALLTTTMKNTALQASRIPDSEGRWPGDIDYVDTYDAYYAALSLLGFLQAQPVIRQSSSEGTAIAVDAPNWNSLIAFYRGQSPIIQAQAGQILVPIPIPDGPHVVPTDMSGRWDGNGDVDTDLS